MPGARSIPTHQQADIVFATAAVWDLKASDFFTRDKHQPLAFARQVAMALSALRFGVPATIEFFKRDRGTIHWALQAVQDRIETDPADRLMVDRVKERLRA